MFERHASDQLAAYLDGQCPDRVSVEAHLHNCDVCREELEQIRYGRSALKWLPRVSAPQHLWAAVEAAADQPGRQPLFGLWRLAAAALLAGALVSYWTWSRRDTTASWQVIALSGSPLAGTRSLAGSQSVRNGEFIETGAASRARILVGDIGSVELEPGTHIRLISTGPTGHRMNLRHGAIAASISAPPRLFMVDTPAGTAIDLGCEYRMNCDRDGNGLLQVTSGWVALEWKGRESLVPAGASCRMYPGQGPGTPCFDDAPGPVISAVEQLDRNPDADTALAVILAAARVRDTLTLWHLLSTVRARNRARVCDRMTALSPPPSGISRDNILNLDAASLQRWREELAWIW